MSAQVRKANFNQDSYLQQFGIAVNTQMTDVQGRVLTPPKILYGGWVCLELSSIYDDKEMCLMC